MAAEAPDKQSQPQDDTRRAVLNATDALALGAALVVAVVGWVGLGLAEANSHGLALVVVLSAVVLVAMGVLAAQWRWRPRLARDPKGLVIALGAAAVAAALTFPGFSYGLTDKDPGVYVAHGVEIARTGGIAFEDPLLKDKVFVQPTSPGAVFAGIWINDAGSGKIVPQFYHLWPALLATAYDVGGLDGIRFVVPLMGVVAVLVLVALLRRLGQAMAGPAAGVMAAAAGGLLLSTNLLQVWQSRYPTTEVLAQALYVAALLGLVIAIQERWAPAAGLAGLFIGVGWLNRGDGFLMVLLAAAFGACLLAARRWDVRATWGAVGLGIVLPHACVQAYVFCRQYTEGNSVPSFVRMSELVLLGLLFALAARTVLRRPARAIVAALQVRRTQARVGLLVSLLAFGLLALGFLRARLFGPDYFLWNGQRLRSYDEQIMQRLSWFLTLPGFAIMWLGIAVVALRRWRASLWVAVVPTLLLFPVYGYSARNSSRLMWGTRRYVPTVLPGIVVLIALALALAFVWRFRGRALLRVPSLVACGGLVAVFLSQSLPLRSHDEFRGSFELSAQISALSPKPNGIYVWDSTACCNRPASLLATAVWLEHGELSVLLALDPTRRQAALRQYASTYPAQPLFLVSGGDALPAGVDPASARRVMSTTRNLPMWQESDTERPSHAVSLAVHVTVWRITPG
ncbi:MAG: hypothetical protein JWM02_2123 [Frankiales bacterium]|nr:hypothetical protein [Frankiales bacterium]